MWVYRVRQLAARDWVWWCIAGLLLGVLQPFLFTHFRQDGWDDESKFGVREEGSMAQFEQDDRSDHSQSLETTLFVPASAHLEQRDTFERGLEALLALVLLSVALTISLVECVHPLTRTFIARVRHMSGAPPPPGGWRIKPPNTAPPSLSTPIDQLA